MTVENVRLVVWDLDETFWKGTLTEGGIQEYVQAHHDIVIELARRGILSSICSKNDAAAILAILKEKGIADYFVFPSISWEPKGVRLAQLVETVRLRAPTVMFIDDNPNDRADAVAAVPGLQVEDEKFLAKILTDPRFKSNNDIQKANPDVPTSEQLITKLAIEQAARVRRMEEAREFVHASYETLLRRNPEAGVVDRVARLMAEGLTSGAAHLRAAVRSREFGSKWQATNPALQLDRTKLIDSNSLRVPDELTVTQLVPKRVIFVGSCLSEAVQVRMRQLPIPIESDLYFVGTELPSVPERPLADYDFQLVQLPLRKILPDSVFARLSQLDEAGHQKLFSHAVHSMRQSFEQAMAWNKKLGLLTFVIPYIVPMQNPVGRLLPRYSLSNPIYFIEKLNEALSMEMENFSNTYLFDFNEILSFYGRRLAQDDLITGFNHGAFITNFDAKFDGNRLEPAGKATDFFEAQVNEIFPAFIRELIGLYRTVRQVDQVKLVVVDLDDTLWRGVIAELDLDNLPSTEGWPLSVWEALLMLKRRGILLAIISKNEEARVLQAWDRIFSKRLSLDDFAARKINWIPKPQNMAEILAQVNLLPANVLYIDDNPAERAAMKGAFPDMRVLGGSPLTWRRILLWSSETQVPNVTAESAVRTDMVRAQVTREEQRQTMSREEFLASLNVTMALFEVKDPEHPRFSRVFELINKTNQFNTTGRRWTREECVAAFNSGVSFYAFEVSDHYTDYGLVGVLVVDSKGILQFVMSCRIMGLEVEIACCCRLNIDQKTEVLPTEN